MLNNTKKEKQLIIEHFRSKMECKIIGDSHEGKIVISKRVDYDKSTFYIIKTEILENITNEEFIIRDEENFYNTLSHILDNAKFKMIDYLHKRDIE